jgi:CubicO group peptidase (beta-lactamase class C family)
LCSLLFLGLGACATAPEAVRRLDGTGISPAQVDGVVTRLMEAGRVPGLGLAIIDGGRIVHLKAYGLRDVEAGRPLTTDTVMYGASLTKAAFAYMVMTLVEEGRIDLDRPIGASLERPLPEYEKYRDLAGDPRWQRLTPRMLLSHTSGFPNWRFLNDDGRLDIKFEPGSRYAYSGEGINLLQFVIEEGIGLSVGTLMQSRVFDRFGMRRTGMTWRDDFAGNLAIGYDEQGRPLGHNLRKNVRAAGSMDTTVADYARFLAGVLRGDGLGESARREMLRPQVAIHSTQQFPTTAKGTTVDNRGIELAYGLGWGLFTSPHGRAYFKEGHDDGWNNYAVTFAERQSALLLMANSSNGESIFKYLADALLGETCMPWFWEGYIPYDRPGLISAEALKHPHPPCGPVR